MPLLLALLLVIQPAQTGAIHVLVEAGDTVYLDGRVVGVSSPEEGGLLLDVVAQGDHRIEVRTPTGGRATANVTVVAGNTSTVQISSLGLRIRARGNDSTIEIDVTPDSATCDLTVGSDRVTAAPAELRAEHVRPGPQRVAVTCGDRHAASDLEIPGGKIVTVQANLDTHKLRVIHERERVTALMVPSVADTIMRLDLPFTWKRAIAATLPPGVKPSSVVRAGNLSVAVTFNAPNWGVAETFRAQLEDRSEVNTVYVRSYDSSRDGLQLTYVIFFRN